MGRNISGLAFDMEGTAFSVEKCHHEGLAHAAGTYGIAVTEWGIIQIPGVINPEEYRLRKMKNTMSCWKQRPLRSGLASGLSALKFRSTCRVRLPL